MGLCPAATSATGEGAGNGASCDDNDACTDGDVCREGGCARSAIDCSSAGEACNRGVCDAQTGACEREPLERCRCVLDGTELDPLIGQGAVTLADSQVPSLGR